MNSKLLIQRMMLATSLAGLIYINASLILYGSDNKEFAQPAFLMIGWFRMRPSFIDLRWVTATSECSVSLVEMMARRSVGCSAYGPIGLGGLEYPPRAIDVSFLLKRGKIDFGNFLLLVSISAFLAS